MENKSLHITHDFSNTIFQIWDAWTKPEHLVNWWGPEGFTSTIHQLEFKEGGEWNLTLHGPDGTNYPNKSIFKEIIPLQKIVFEHFYPHFMTTVLFESNNEGTKVDWTMEFDTPEQYEVIVKVHKADEGQKQNLEKLEKYLANLTS